MAAGSGDAALARGRAQPLLLRAQGRLHVLRGAQGTADRRLPHLVSERGPRWSGEPARPGLTAARSVAGRSARSR